MNLLAFDTSTEPCQWPCSLCARRRPAAVTHSGAGGAQASATLIPTALACWPRPG
jgi:hypothetical protein